MQVCQLMFGGDHNAGTNDTTFSVDTEGNPIIAYGGIMDEFGYTRY